MPEGGHADKAMLTRVNHVGIVVSDLPSAERLLGELFGLDCVRRVEAPELSVQAAFYRCGDIDLELVGVTDPDERDRRLGGHGVQGRIEHIAIEAGTAEEIKTLLDQASINLVSPDPLVVAGTSSFWSKPETTAGIILQFIVSSTAPKEASTS